jgi:hypothetical protein
VHPAEQQAAWQGHRAQNWQSEHRDWQQRGGYHGYRIPDDRYRGHFGRDHWFRIYSYPVVVVGGFPRFQYDGFWFSIIDPWPESWSDDWYDNDDVYIDYSDGGYYLYNRRYPGDRIAVEVYLNERFVECDAIDTGRRIAPTFVGSIWEVSASAPTARGSQSGLADRAERETSLNLEQGTKDKARPHGGQ